MYTEERNSFCRIQRCRHSICIRQETTSDKNLGKFSVLKMKFIDKMHEQGIRNVRKRRQNAAIENFTAFTYTWFLECVCVCVLMGQKCKNCVDLANLDSTFDYGFIFRCSRLPSTTLADRLVDCLNFTFVSHNPVRKPFSPIRRCVAFKFFTFYFD